MVIVVVGVVRLVGAQLAGYLVSIQAVASVAAIARGSAFVIAFCVLPESLALNARKPPLNWASAAEIAPVLNPFANIKILARSTVFQRVAATLFVATVAKKGVDAVVPSYQRQVLDFSEHNFVVSK